MFKETKTIIHSNKINKNIRLLVMSDIHYFNIRDNKKLNKIVNAAKKYKLDYICIPGDLIDSPKSTDKEYFIDFIKNLSKIATVILSLGNHDIRDKDEKYFNYYDKDFYDKLNLLDNVYFLNNTSKTFKDIYFYGFTQSFDYYYLNRYEDANLMVKEIKDNNISKVNDNKFNVLLMHSPYHIGNDIVKDYLNKYDLVLSGHMHNGGIPPIFDDIFKGNRGIIAPKNSFFPKNARGVKRENNVVVISSGVTKLSNSAPIPFRWLNILFPIGINIIEITNSKTDVKDTSRYFNK